MEQITAKDFLKAKFPLWEHQDRDQFNTVSLIEENLIEAMDEYASLRSVSETKEPEIIKATGEALHDIQVEDKFIDRLLKEFEDNGISTENWDGDESPEYCIVMGVLRHIENVSPVPVSEVEQVEELVKRECVNFLDDLKDYYHESKTNILSPDEEERTSEQLYDIYREENPLLQVPNTKTVEGEATEKLHKIMESFRLSLDDLRHNINIYRAMDVGEQKELWNAISNMITEVELLSSLRSNEPETMLDDKLNGTGLFYDFPENKPLYKDSGLWQLRTDDMEDVLVDQKVNESFEDFIIRCKKEGGNNA